ncbi:sterol desaturase family protein [Novosphingobium sp. TH158]|uniref:sterol desaturase family protein n=1 Tax=Novosphingobium sp. TH158 TaxID=2067455 RepID=UPI000C7CBE73|nr:sterol desaturase family protein [Novosphingobium sp. TH158]PLK24310.1 fatty acid hydroxylase [Novosphingobium sp. TH158]
MKTEGFWILAIFLCFAVIEALRGSFLHKRGQTRDDALVELIGSPVLLLVTQPLILLVAWLGMAWAFPDHAGALAALPVIAQVALLLIFDDMAQYWWHRASHSFPWLYNLHRAHHSGEYMSVRIVFRNNVFYYLTMPSLWFSGALIYLGLGAVYVPYVVIKQLVIIAAHSDVPWDRPLYRIRWLSPLMWLVERTISTPSTHSAHHGKHLSDGVTHYKGNFGNLLFLWDVLFGTAKITRRYPAEIGIENLPPITAAEQLAWPLFRSEATRQT